MIKNQYFFQLFSSLCTLLLLAITPAASVAVGNKKNSNTALLVVNGRILQREIARDSSIQVPVSGMGAITSASVMTNDVRCFFHRRDYFNIDPDTDGSRQRSFALGSDGRYSQSFISPVFGRNYDLEFADAFHFYNTLVCSKGPEGVASILVEYEDGGFFGVNHYVSFLDEIDQLKINFKEGMQKDLLKATLLESPYPDLRCKILGSDMFMVDIKLGQPYPSNIPGVREIFCKREKDWA